MHDKRVLVYRELPPDQLARIERTHKVVVANPRVAEQKDTFLRELPNAHGLIGSSFPFDENLLAMAGRLEVISTISVGVDNYPVQALQQRGIMLCHTPGVLTESVADLLFAMVLGSSRRVHELASYVDEGRWIRNIGPELFGWDVHGKTLGILGYGRIGQALAKRAALGFNMPVLYMSRTPPDPGALAGHARAASFQTLLEQSDFVVITLPLTEQTRGLIGHDEFAMMKPGAILINGARGPIVHEQALLAALSSGRLRAAALDVFDVEPLPQGSLLRGNSKILALPHVGSATHETRYAMAEMATSNLLLALEGKQPLAVYSRAG